jgi:hypothetical protein
MTSGFGTNSLVQILRRFSSNDTRSCPAMKPLAFARAFSIVVVVVVVPFPSVDRKQLLVLLFD